MKTMNLYRIILASRALSVTRLRGSPKTEFTSPACEEPAEGTRQIWQRYFRPPALGYQKHSAVKHLCFWKEWRRVWSRKATPQRKARRDTAEPKYRHQATDRHAVVMETGWRLRQPGWTAALALTRARCFAGAVKPLRGEDTWSTASAGNKTKRWAAASTSCERWAPPPFCWERRNRKTGISE